MQWCWWMCLTAAALTTSTVGTNKVPIRGEILKVLGDEEAKVLAGWYDHNIIRAVHNQAKSEWAYSTNINPENENVMIQGRLQVAEFTKKAHQTLSKYDWQGLQDEDLRRQFRQMVMPGHAALPEDKLRKLLSTEAKMLDIQSKAIACQVEDDGKPFCITDKDISLTFAKSTHEPTLCFYWKLWHDQQGQMMREPFEQYVQLSNELAVGNNFTDLGDLWRSSYEWPTLERDVQQLWQQIKPLYLQLHAYARRQLRKVYGSELVPNGGLIPAHLLGDLLAYDWSGIPVPFPNTSTSNITQRMHEQNYTVKTIIEVAENFFFSLGLPPMPSTFWNNSIFEDPRDGRKVMCHGTAWDFYDKKDFRILICADVIAEQMYTIHHEMGHLHYFMQYKDQPYIFRTAANPAFHEAIGDLILLSVMTPKHLNAIGLLNNFQESRESDINFLFTEALSTIAPLPSGFVIDRWRWDIFSGKSNSDDWNERWWQLKEIYQGMACPTQREKKDLDPGVIFHVATFAPFVRYFLSGILKYQFHRALCREAGEYVPGDPSKPLFKCDIYGSKEAGELLRKMMEMGASKRWDHAMRVISRGQEDRFDGSALLEYYQPLMDFLAEDNERHGETIGWSSSGKSCSKSKPNRGNKFSSTASFNNCAKGTCTDCSTTLKLALMILLINCFLKGP